MVKTPESAQTPDDKLIITHPDVGGGKAEASVTREQYDVVYKDKGWKISSEDAEAAAVVETKIMRSGEPVSELGS